MTVHRFAPVISLLVGLACARSAPPTTIIPLDQDVVLAPATPVAVPSSNLRLSFERVSADSRCPADAVCVWAGNATVQVRVTDNGQLPREFSLNSTTAPTSVSFDGYVLRFVALSPTPVSTTPIDPKDYRLTIRLERP
ncbi:MAG: hypothetical protein ACRENU_17370 [Gemmatimonadaceae bacterium]